MKRIGYYTFGIFLCLLAQTARGVEILILEINGEHIPSSFETASPSSKNSVQDRKYKSDEPEISAGSIMLESGFPFEIKGQVKNLKDSNIQKYRLYIIIHRMYDDYWWIAGSSELEISENRESNLWHVQNIRIDQDDLGKGYELGAILVDSKKKGLLSVGAIRYQTIQSLAYASANLIPVDLGPREAKDCYVTVNRIKNIEDQWIDKFKDDQKIEVGLSTTLEGEMVKPTNAELRIIVKPETDNKIWVQERRTMKNDKVAGNNVIWSDVAFLGRKGQDTGTTYRIQAVVFKSPFDSSFCRESSKMNDEAFKDSCLPDEWRRIENNICARSVQLTVTRREQLTDLIISKIGDREISKNQQEIVEINDLELQVFGSVIFPHPDLTLEGSELVWLLIRPTTNSDSSWMVKIRAIVSQDKLSWRTPPFNLESGRYKIMAIATKQNFLKGNVKMNDDNWSKATRLSKPIPIKVTTEGDIK